MARPFELENDKIERENKTRGLIISVTFHAGLFLLLWCIIGVSQFNPPLDSEKEAGGVMVNLGYMNDGKGAVQPTNTDNKIEVPQPVASKSEPPAKAKADKVITSNIPDAPFISNKPVKKPKKEVKPTKKTPVTTVVTNAPPVVAPPKPKALYTGGPANNSPGEGNGTKAGDKGQTNGSPFGDSYTGNPGLGGGPGGRGSGPGYSYSLNGRSLLVKPVINDKSQETGKVVLRITVDKSGKITAADGPVQGSTTTSTYLLGLAKKAALGCKFNSPSGVPDEQFGTITFIFTVK